MKNVIELFDLHGQVAVITGGAGLLGVEFCHTLAQAGAHIVVADLDLQAAEAVVQKLRDAGAQAIAVRTDVTDPASTQTMATLAVEMFGRLDILVNSAALDPKFDPQNAEERLNHAGNGAFG